ncbi:protein brambleberry isoform X2 [Gouania willdenowi]|nr:protein brambleberry-like isoform X2 [Gouania willdenowi]
MDSCHYRVVARLKSSCESLTEEKLAKLGVELFNCQAAIEGRPTYPCSEEMTIRDCTSDMDPDTWNSYHIVSNRARSVCYATRQQLFRRRAEHTVNALISTATSQLDAMNDLKEGQLELKELTAASLQRLLDGHGALRAQQDQLSKGQQHMENSLTENLQRLSQEKALIASGQQLVAQLIQGITQRMENVSETVQVHGSEVQQSHDAIVHDLTAVRHQAQDIYHKIDHSMSEFLQYQDQTSQYYADLMVKLERMNNTLGVVLHFLDNLQGRLEERLHVIQGYLGWAGLSLAATWTCIVHTSYFVTCAVLLTFLRFPAFSRATLLLTVTLNAVAEIHQQAALDLSSLSVLLLTATMGYWFVRQLWAGLQLRTKQTRPLPLAACGVVTPQKKLVSVHHSYPVSSTPCRNKNDIIGEETDVLNRDSFLSGELCVSAPESRLMSGSGSLMISDPRFKPSLAVAASMMDDIPLRNLGTLMDGLNDTRHLLTDSRSASPTPSTVSNSSLSARHLCNGTTKTGKACKKRAVLGQEFCRVHEGGHSSYTQS